jgi:hypothetical protein
LITVGKATVYRSSDFTRADLFWSDPDVFIGRVRGMAPADDGLFIREASLINCRAMDRH